MMPTQTREVGWRSRVPWDWTDILLFLPIFVIAVSVFTLAVTVIVEPFTQGKGEFPKAVQALAATVAFYAAGFTAVWVLVVGRRKGRLSQLGWRMPSRWWWFLLTPPLAYVCLIVAARLGDLSSRLFPNSQSAQCQNVQQEYGHALAIAIVAVSIIAPIVEETIFRGFLYSWLRNRMPVAGAVLASAALFGLAHLPQGVVLFMPLAGVGIVLALVYEWASSIWPGAGIHALFNLAGIIAFLTHSC